MEDGSCLHHNSIINRTTGHSAAAVWLATSDTGNTSGQDELGTNPGSSYAHKMAAINTD